MTVFVKIKNIHRADDTLGNVVRIAGDNYAGDMRHGGIINLVADNVKEIQNRHSVFKNYAELIQC